MHVELQRVAPAEIEARSMEIIRSELKRPLPPVKWQRARKSP